MSRPPDGIRPKRRKYVIKNGGYNHGKDNKTQIEREYMTQNKEGQEMKITSEISLRDFEGWSGAVDTLNILTDEQKDAIEANLEELWSDGMDETSLNDFLWFDNDTIAEWLGFEDWEDLERKNSGEEEDEEDED